jgi:hypothetical protein
MGAGKDQRDKESSARHFVSPPVELFRRRYSMSDRGRTMRCGRRVLPNLGGWNTFSVACGPRRAQARCGLRGEEPQTVYTSGGLGF